MHRVIVFVHVLSAFGFVLVHGVSATVAFRLRRERNMERLRALLDLSVEYMGFTYGALLLLILSGVAAGFTARVWGQGWIWTSLGLLIGISVAMFLYGSLYYSQVRKAVGLAYFENWKEHPPVDPAPPEQLDALLGSRRPEVLTIMGLGGLALILWLMMFKPF